MCSRFPRVPGTPAARMPQLERREIKARAQALAREGRAGAQRDHLSGFAGREVEILMEQPQRGRAPQFAEVNLPEPGEPGALVRAYITGLALESWKERWPRERNPDEKTGLFGRLFKGDDRDRRRKPESRAEREPTARSRKIGTKRPSRSRKRSRRTRAGQAEVVEPAPEPDPAPQKKGWFSRLKDGLTKTSSRLSDGITGVFTKRKLDDDTLEELEDLLIQADLGVETAMRITERLSAEKYDKEISPDEVREVLAAEVAKTLEPVAQPLRIDADNKPHVILVVGVNGTGKTTTIGKFARKFADDGKSVLLAAGDTFRAAAVEQLKSGASAWARR